MTIDVFFPAPTRSAPMMAADVPGHLSSFLRLIAEPNRLRILALLGGGERCVCDIESALDLPQNLTSHHLAALKRAGLLHDRRDGRWVYYRLASNVLRARVTELTVLLGSEQANTQATPCNPNEIR